MRTQVCTTLAALALAAWSAGAPAQTAPSATVPGPGPAVVSDAAPPPAEDRSSPGAIVLDAPPVRALRDRSASDPAVMGAGPAPLTGKAKREAEALRRKGAGARGR